MKQLLTIKEEQRKIEQLIDLIQKGVDAWIESGKILVELVESNPHIYDNIIQKCPTLNAGVLGKLEMMGRGMLHPRLLLGNSPGFQYLEKMPMSVQERYIEEPIPLVIETDAGTDVILVKAKDLTRDQARQVFAANRLRTEGEQKAILIDQRSKNAKPVNQKAVSN